MTATQRIELRVDTETKALIESAANVAHVSVGAFLRKAAEDRAHDVMREHEMRTVIPAEFFDDLLDALDAPPVRNEPLTRAARRRIDRVGKR